MTQHGMQGFFFTCRVYGDLVIASYNSSSMSCGQCILDIQPVTCIRYVSMFREFKGARALARPVTICDCNDTESYK